MGIKAVIYLIGLAFASSCVSTGYVPSYIISDTSEVEAEEQNINKQEEVR